MKVKPFGRAASISEVASGTVFSRFENGQHSRMIKVAGTASPGYILAVPIGPYFFLEDGVGVTTVYDNEIVLVEDHIQLSPKVIDKTGAIISPMDPTLKEVGTVCYSADGKMLLYVRVRAGERAFVDVETGEFLSKQRKIAACYLHYVLISHDQLGNEIVIFDSSQTSKFMASAA